MSHKTVFYALGTKNSITIEEEHSTEVLLRVIERVFEIEEKMSAFKNTSEVSKITLSAGFHPVPVSNDVFSVLEKALEISQASNGAFDITVRPLTKLWSFGSGNDAVPEKLKIEAAKSFVAYQNLVLDSKGKTAFLTKIGCAVDLGGIAKGYAANEAKRILSEHGIKNALINFGGNVMAVGSSFEYTPWKVGIQNPLLGRGKDALIIDATDKAVVSAAVNERFFIKEGIRYHHIINPLSGYPAQNGLLSVTVIDKCSMLADALSTAVFVLGAAEGMKLIKQYKSDAVFITESGNIFSTIPARISNNVAQLENC